jgi:hypothetical protein
VNEFEWSSLSEPGDSCKGAVEFLHKECATAGCLEEAFIFISIHAGKGGETKDSFRGRESTT